MELAASVCSAYHHHLSAPADGDGGESGAQAPPAAQPARGRRRRKHAGGCAGLRRRCLAVLRQHRARLYILRRCVAMLLCWHEHDLSD